MYVKTQTFFRSKFSAFASNQPWCMRMEKRPSLIFLQEWFSWEDLTLMKKKSKYLTLSKGDESIKDMFSSCRTLKSNVTCKEEFPDECVPVKPLTNPIVGCCKDDKTDNCLKYNVTAKGFFSSYTQKVEDSVLDGAKELIFEVLSNKSKWSHKIFSF